MDNSKFSQSNILYLEQLPKYDLFLSQVVDFLNTYFPDENYTTNIIQNYIKSGVISSPLDGKKCGYTKDHLIQLALVSYMRPILTAEEIKKVFALAFNDINNHLDDFISWETAYKFFCEIQDESIDNSFSSLIIDENKLMTIIQSEGLKGENAKSVHTFLSVMNLVAKSALVKKFAQKIIALHNN